MINELVSSLEDYEKDFLAFQEQIDSLRKSNPNEFIAFKEGQMISSSRYLEEVKKELTTQGIEPSGTVIEFVAKDEIQMIV